MVDPETQLLQLISDVLRELRWRNTPRNRLLVMTAIEDSIMEGRGYSTEAVKRTAERLRHRQRPIGPVRRAPRKAR